MERYAKPRVSGPFNRLGFEPGSSAVDVGCGEGRYSIELAKRPRRRKSAGSACRQIAAFAGNVSGSVRTAILRRHARRLSVAHLSDDRQAQPTDLLAQKACVLVVGVG